MAVLFSCLPHLLKHWAQNQVEKIHHGNQKVEGVSRSWEGRSPCSMHTPWCTRFHRDPCSDRHRPSTSCAISGHPEVTSLSPHGARPHTPGSGGAWMHWPVPPLRGLREGLASGEVLPQSLCRAGGLALSGFPVSVSKHGLCPPRCEDDVSQVPLSPTACCTWSW